MKNIFYVFLNCIAIMIAVVIQKVLYRTGIIYDSLLMYWGTILLIFSIISLCIEQSRNATTNDS